MSKISTKAEVHKNAVIGKNVEIGPFSVIDENVKIGDNTLIGPNAHISGWTDIGKNNEIHHGAAIGDYPQDLSFKKEKSFLTIGDNNIIREFATFHRGTKPDSRTIVGNNNMFMVYSHVGHNSIVKDSVIMVNSSSLGGYVEVDSNTFISACAQIHQFCKIGRYVMVAPLTKVSKDVPPFMLLTGADTAVVRGLNVVALRRAEISQDDREVIKKAYKLLYHSDLNTSEAVKRIRSEPDLSSHKYIKEMLDFIQKSERGICGHYKK
ncbi:MAG: acyl-ACP--UDP-N-acetylglucosamine O-acyltransferase [Spirochaetes bacterium]|nr:acyl-ACP--UDP-N-acetylglucosamine O-acyltransferase [Spirochaetota bacterium]